MWERVEIGRQDSDTTLFLNLMYYGEMAAKLAVAAMVAAIGDDKDRSRYRATATLVRADGIGDWALRHPLIKACIIHALPEAWHHRTPQSCLNAA